MSRQKLTTQIRRADKAQDDGLLWQTKNNKDEVRRRMDRQTMSEAFGRVMTSCNTSHPHLNGGGTAYALQ